MKPPAVDKDLDRIIELEDTDRIRRVTRPTAYLWRMAGFLVAIGFVAVFVREDVYRFFLRNPPLNSLVLGVLGLGIWLAFRAVTSLEAEVAWISRCQENRGIRPADLAPTLMAPLAALMRESKTKLSLSPASLRSLLDGIGSRLDERREVLRYCTTLLIFLGLLGTFWGLLMMANSVGETIRNLNVGGGTDPAQMFETLRQGLEGPLSGMGTAFSTSLFGLASSLVLGFLDLQASQAQNRFADDVETWLMGSSHGDVAAPSSHGAPAPSYVYALLEKTAESFDGLYNRLERGLDDNAKTHAALREVVAQLGVVAERMRPLEGQDHDPQESLVLLRRIADSLSGAKTRGDDEARSHLRNIDRAVNRLAEDGERLHDHLVDEIREEIRLLARTLSVIADRER